MSDPAEQGTTTRYDWPGIADLIFLFVTVAVLANASKGLLEDPGLGWHLRNIDAIRAHGWWLTEDPFTEPHAGKGAWYTNQWLGELPFYAGWKLAGLEGIAAVAAILIAAIARAFYRIFIHDGLPWPAAVFWTALGTLGTSCSWVARPNLFTILFVLITARAVYLFHAGRTSRRATLWLLPLFAVWANTHGGFLAGFIVVGLALAAETATWVGSFDPATGEAARGRAVHLGLLSGGLFLATLINPYGPWLYRFVFSLLGNEYFMNLNQEWKSPDFHSAGAMRYELLILLFPLVLAVSARRPGLPELLTAVAWLHLALTGFRYVALWVVVAVPLMARASVEIPYLLELARRWNLTTAPGSLFETRRGGSVWLWSALFAAGVGVWAYASRGKVIHPQQKIVATKALDEFVRMAGEWEEKHGRRPRLFHSYDWGGYITWHGWPRLLNWIDDRNEVQRQDRVELWKQTMHGLPVWEETLAEVDLVCISPKTHLEERLRGAKAEWVERYKDDHAVIFERRTPQKR